MMTCKQIREKLLTDYLDREADEHLKKQIEAHLGLCPGCRQLLEAYQANMRMPLGRDPIIRPPESVWQRIKESLETEEERKARSVFSGLFGAVPVFLRAHKPAFATVTAIITVIIVGIAAVRGPIRNRYLLDSYLMEQGQFFTNGNGAASAVDMGTSIEEFFF